MATKIRCSINLSKAKAFITKSEKTGESYLNFTIYKNFNDEVRYGQTHNIQIYNAEEKKAIFVGNGVEEETQKRDSAPAPSQAPAPAKKTSKSAPAEKEDDLPF